jgi:hypothetical protein
MSIGFFFVLSHLREVQISGIEVFRRYHFRSIMVKEPHFRRGHNDVMRAVLQATQGHMAGGSSTVTGKKHKRL